MINIIFLAIDKIKHALKKTLSYKDKGHLVIRWSGCIQSLNIFNEFLYSEFWGEFLNSCFRIELIIKKQIVNFMPQDKRCKLVRRRRFIIQYTP